jgi:transcriptional regulator with XRE-family HTH domain
MAHPDATGFTSRMGQVVTGDVGGRLRIAREQGGMSLPEVARRTRLTVAVLQAIERNDFASLPGGMFRKAYVRTLAAEFGLDADEVAAEYCAQFEPASEEAPASIDAAVEEKWLQQLTPSPRRSVITLAALAAPAVAWFMLQPASVSPSVPVRAINELPAGPVINDASTMLTAERPVRVRTAAAGASAATVPLRIEIAASDWCWVAAESDGRRVMYRLVEPGERLMLEGQHLISLRLGDAGAMTLSINGGPERSIGVDGEVAELEVTLDNVDTLRDGAVTAASDG